MMLVSLPARVCFVADQTFARYTDVRLPVYENGQQLSPSCNEEKNDVLNQRGVRVLHTFYCTFAHDLNSLADVKRVKCDSRSV